MSDKSWLAQLVRGATAGGRASAANVGVHLTHNGIAAVRVRAAVPLPVVEEAREHSFEREHGPGAAVRALAEGGFLQGARVLLALPGGSYEILPTSTPPAVPEEEMRDALRWQLRGSLQYPPEEAAFDFLRLPQRREAGSASAPAAGMLVIAARRADVERVATPLAAAGIAVEVVDIPEMAQRNLLGSGEGQTGCRGFLSFDQSSSLLTVQLADELCFARRMQLPGYGSLNEEEPEHLADRVASNVQRSLEVFVRQSHLPDVTGLTVGAHVHASLFARAIQEQAEVPTALFDPYMVVANAQALQVSLRDAEAPMSGAMMLALGVALRDHLGRNARPAATLGLPNWLLPWKKAA